MGPSPPHDTNRFLMETGVPQNGVLPRFRFHLLASRPRFEHAVFTRLGGVSAPPFDSLNVGLGTGDSPSAVQENRDRIRRFMGADRLVVLKQVHGENVVVLRREDMDGATQPLRGDGLVTDVPGTGLVIQQADCQAVILFDPVRRVVANVHCGWRGNVANILGNAVRVMGEAFRCEPEEVLAGVGPSLGPCCGEFRGHEEIFPESFRAFEVRENHFDLWALSLHQLMEAGLRREHVALARICTRCRRDLFFSYRGEGITGRFATLAMLGA